MSHSSGDPFPHLVVEDYIDDSAYSELCETFPDVVNRRELSQTAAQQTGVEHKSPQAIWIADGLAVWNASHFDITQASLAEAAETAG